jgi:hypothetical protein
MAKPQWTTLDQLARRAGARPPDSGHRTRGVLSRRGDGKALILNVSLSTNPTQVLRRVRRLWSP